MKLNILHITLPVLTVIMLSACSGNDDTNSAADPSGIISYTVKASPTRSSVISGTTFPTDKTFRVWAYEEGSTEALIGGDIVSCTDGSVWSTETKYYWPQGTKVNFYALYPTSLSYNIANASFSYTVPTDVSQQQDVLYDVIKAGKTDDNISHNSVKRYAVPLTFRHALSQVAFRASISDENSDFTVEVSGITMHNVYTSGMFNLTTRSWGSLSSVDNLAIGISSDAGAITYGGDPVSVTADDGMLLVIPQSLSGWALGTNVNSTSDCYLAVDCHVTGSGGVDLLGTSSAPATVYVPFDNSSTIWEAGKKYIYNLQFGTGYDAGGNRQLQVLIVGSEITDWTNGTGGDVDAKMTTTE